MTQTTHEWIMSLFSAPGYFVEAGAHDGIGDSMTYSLEQIGWKGLCVEPSSFFPRLKANRSCNVDSRCIWTHDNDTVSFWEVPGNSIELSGIQGHFDDEWDRSDGKVVEKDTVSMTTLLKEHEAPGIIDFLSLDTEGTEFQILNAHDFDKYKFLAIQVEHNNAIERRDRVRKLLLRKGYLFIEQNHVDDRFLHKDYLESPKRFAHVEIEICSHCDCNCWACDRLVNVCPTTAMTVEQVRHFVEESFALDWKWERIHILGGEPTLHPQLREIVEELLKYKERYPDTLLRIISNGQGKLREHSDWLKSKGIDVRIEGKLPGTEPEYFRNHRMAPIDRFPDLKPAPPCGIFGVRGCGLGITKHGIFLCGSGASIARVVGQDIGVMSLKDLTWEAMLGQADELCHICGHWSTPDIGSMMTETGKVMSPFWEETLKDWKPLPMSTYGEPHVDG